MSKIHEIIAKKGLLKKSQFDFLEAIDSNKIISLYSELHLLLYLGVILFTAGIGYLVYENLGGIGHFVIMASMGVLVIIGFKFLQKKAKSYSTNLVEVEHPYFDYILLLVTLLSVSLFAYVEIYFELVNLLIQYTSFMGAAFFILLAYRYDNRAVLSMGIIMLAAALGLSISPVDWELGEWFMAEQLYWVSILFGGFLVVAGQFSKNLAVKEHFRPTYQNFGLLLYYLGCLTGIFESDLSIYFACFTLISSGLFAYYTWRQKYFLFFLYSSITFYIAITYLLFELLVMSGGDGFVIFIYYIPASIIGFIVLLVKKKAHFKDL